MSENRTHTLCLRGVPVAISQPWVMGILNATPDSFFSQSRCINIMEMEVRARQIVDEGARIIDVGACSTRPGSTPVSAEDEMLRLDLALEVVKDICPEVYVSVDTFRASVARHCVERWGVDIINDIGGGNLDEEMFATVAQLGVPYVLTHSRGTPATMQGMTQYANVADEVLQDLTAKAAALRQLGATQIILDPGFGFGKTTEQNFALMTRLADFARTGMPVLVGVSRKSMICNALGVTPDKALHGTTALHMYALTQGATFLRAHDVAAAAQAITIHSRLNPNPNPDPDPNPNPNPD